MTKQINIGVIGGDGIGPEVTAVALEAMNLATRGSGVEFVTTEYDLGAKRYAATGEILTDKDMESLKAHDAILLGAIGDPSVPSGVLERGLLLKLRFSFDHYINLRPTKYTQELLAHLLSLATLTSLLSAKALKVLMLVTVVLFVLVPTMKLLMKLL